MKQSFSDIFRHLSSKKTAVRPASFLQIFLLIITFCSISVSQNLPDKIRGYKVYKAKISVKTVSEKTVSKSESEAFITIGEPELADVSLTGITLELSAEIDALEQTGKIDFLDFTDFRVNNLPVEVEEYKYPFEIKKNRATALPKPARIFVGTAQTLRGALNELKNSKDIWRVTGRIFVFGKFKKFGFSFKRVIPVEIDIAIKNPLIRQNKQPDKIN